MSDRCLSMISCCTCGLEKNHQGKHQCGRCGFRWDSELETLMQDMEAKN